MLSCFSGLQFPFSFFFFIAARLVDPPILLFRRIVIVVQITRIWKNKKGKIKIELCLVLFKFITIFFFGFWQRSQRLRGRLREKELAGYLWKFNEDDFLRSPLLLIYFQFEFVYSSKFLVFVHSFRKDHFDKNLTSECVCLALYSSV